MNTEEWIRWTLHINSHRVLFSSSVSCTALSEPSAIADILRSQLSWVDFSVCLLLPTVLREQCKRQTRRKGLYVSLYVKFILFIPLCSFSYWEELYQFFPLTTSLFWRRWINVSFLWPLGKYSISSDEIDFIKASVKSLIPQEENYIFPHWRLNQKKITWINIIFNFKRYK